jgi:hypothetical protein
MGRQKLVDGFHKAEAGLEIDQTVFEGIDDLFIKLFTIVKDKSSDNAQLFSLDEFLHLREGNTEQKQKKRICHPKQCLPLPPGCRERSKEWPKSEAGSLHITSTWNPSGLV